MTRKLVGLITKWLFSLGITLLLMILGYFEGNVIKYVTRYKAKGGVEDLRKAQHYLSKLIEVNSKD